MLKGDMNDSLWATTWHRIWLLSSWGANLISCPIGTQCKFFILCWALRAEFWANTCEPHVYQTLQKTLLFPKIISPIAIISYFDINIIFLFESFFFIITWANQNVII
jgi:hypothetical protein